MANDRQLESVAIPPIGNGVLKIPLKVCCKGMLNGIINFIKKVTKSGKEFNIKNIKICIFEKPDAVKFQKVWVENCKEGDEEEKTIPAQAEPREENKKPKRRIRKPSMGKSILKKPNLINSAVSDSEDTPDDSDNSEINIKKVGFKSSLDKHQNSDSDSSEGTIKSNAFIKKPNKIPNSGRKMSKRKYESS
eukprot:CAMPEP_0205806656 /NCGR_PEP_ID=MMETSP0205-20121125/10285_1 /ASSEMBLY_ACC=CAM_ASM_000278 /TAXON_ID=36767 /ORGANISM="Euplotes focardii, Strain TN1" /LENGTH=190 /DNA_ID=CAMNT_0053079903 /DNA_START=293 /DNA_END=861 /DNA_ORIENTATION=-